MSVFFMSVFFIIRLFSKLFTKHLQNWYDLRISKLMFLDILVNVLFKIDTVKRNIYPKNFIDICFEFFLKRIHIHKEKTPTVEKKPLSLVLTYLETISLKS